MKRRDFLSCIATLAGTGTLQAQSRFPGTPALPEGGKAPQEQLQKTVQGLMQTESATPIHRLHGMITPSDLHFERHHSGVPAINPEQYELLLHGLVETPLTFTLQDLKRFPAVSR
ncbi:molybdopterin-dependent oxidoreductase [Endozoicomonas euniceicola]|uniref:Molybdopterin-dependent oxidoreductase n=1 Tax=Endozoicomonas euniceicola TaxID=1234143 RepID=A0ABY6H054_9GAMM|nr:molybdopterin-dependent oxidoreductase [Endozoicomonas euniceicola]UYM17681.1 molybdopterin-dependent oxidoreductase [Endozoicomonas euniceicola]